MKSKLSFFILFIILFATIATAQEEKYSIQLQVIGSVPSGSFGTFSDGATKMTKRVGVQAGDKIGLAKKGFGIGGEFATPIWFKGMNWVFSAQVLFNGINSDEVQSKINSSQFWKLDSLGRQDTVVSLDYGFWLNIPVMTGLKYKYEISNGFDIFGIVSAGINFTKAPSLKTSVSVLGAASDITIEDTKYSLDNVYGWDVGVGAILKGKYSVGIKYLNFGTARYDGTRIINRSYLPTVFYSETHINGEERNISMFLLTFGIML